MGILVFILVFLYCVSLTNVAILLIGAFLAELGNLHMRCCGVFSRYRTKIGLIGFETVGTQCFPLPSFEATE